MGVKKKIKSFFNMSSSKKKIIIPRNLDQATWDNTSPFVPKVTYGRVIKCYDVDTCTIVSKPYENEPVFRFSLRLSGIDGPEIRSKDPGEKQAANMAKMLLTDKILDKYVLLTNVSSDKYGRLLCKIWLDGVCINDWLLEKKVVVPYDGGTKKCPDDWLAYIVKFCPDFIEG